MLRLVPESYRDLWPQYRTEQNRIDDNIEVCINPKLGYSVVPTSRGRIRARRALPNWWYYATARAFTLTTDSGFLYFCSMTILS